MEELIDEHYYRGYYLFQYEKHYEIWQIDGSDEPLAYVKNMKQVDKYIDNVKELRWHIIDWR